MADNFGLIEASGSGHYKKVKKLLAEGADANFDHAHFHHWTPIVWAAMSCVRHPEKSIEIIKDLIAYGADINLAKNDMGYNAVNSAALRGNVDLVRYFVEHGGDVDLAINSLNRDKDRKTVFNLLKDHFKINTTDETIDSAAINEGIVTAAKSGHWVKLKGLVGKIGTLDFIFDGLSPLVASGLASKRPEIGMKLLLDAGADIDYRVDRNGLYEGATALMIAIDRDCFKVADFLLDSGANVFATDGLGLSPLNYAIKRMEMNANLPDNMDKQRMLSERIKAMQEQSILDKSIKEHCSENDKLEF